MREFRHCIVAWKTRTLAISGALLLVVAGCTFGQGGNGCQFATHADAVTKGGGRPQPTDPVIKGYVGRNNEKLYIVPGSALYRRTAIDESKGMRWFCTEKEAEAEGWSNAR